jgi:hypothetical protein
LHTFYFLSVNFYQRPLLVIPASPPKAGESRNPGI